MTHTAGLTLVVPAGNGFAGTGSINDPVACQGTIAAIYSINLNNGLTLSGTGDVNLGWGSLTVNNSGSGITNGTFYGIYLYVGNVGSGTFTQSGGSNTVNNGLFLGYNAGDNGTYSLTGPGGLSAGYEIVGLSGTGSFNQSGATNNTTGVTIGLNLWQQRNLQPQWERTVGTVALSGLSRPRPKCR